MCWFCHAREETLQYSLDECEVYLPLSIFIGTVWLLVLCIGTSMLHIIHIPLGATSWHDHHPLPDVENDEVKLQYYGTVGWLLTSLCVTTNQTLFWYWRRTTIYCFWRLSALLMLMSQTSKMKDIEISNSGYGSASRLLSTYGYYCIWPPWYSILFSDHMFAEAVNLFWLIIWSLTASCHFGHCFLCKDL